MNLGDIVIVTDENAYHFMDIGVIKEITDRYICVYSGKWNEYFLPEKLKVLVHNN